MIELLLCVIVISSVSAGPSRRYAYTYDDTFGQNYYGQNPWSEPFPVCQKKRQSPIDINFDGVSDVSLPPLKMTGFNRRLATTLTNTGHTAQLTIDSAIKPILSGGPLHTKYEFSQLHFHWGENDNIGSERAVRGKKYPIELHVVTFNTDYGDITSAMNYPDGICALSCLFELQNYDNKNYNPLVTTLSQITQPQTSAKIINHPTLLELLPRVLTRYYSYSGSLTTPPYPEVVTWIDFVDTVKISRDQLQQFRYLIDDHGQPMVNNFRDIQPSNDRGVLYNDDDYNSQFC